MSNGIMIHMATLAGFIAIVTPVFSDTAVPASGCANAFATELVSRRNEHRAGVLAVRPETPWMMVVPCDLGDGGCQDMDWANTASSHE